MGLSGDGGETLHYQSVVDSRADPDDACVAEGFFDLANAAVVRYSVGGDAPDAANADAAANDRTPRVELMVEQDQSLHDCCGGIVWESAFCLAQYLRGEARARRIRGRRVLELGAGAGLLGLAAAASGAKRVVLTDHPDAMPLLTRNVERNAEALAGHGVGDGDPRDEDETGDGTAVGIGDARASRRRRIPKCLPLDWTVDSQLDAVADLGPFDVVLATDVVFNVDLVDPLIRCLRRCVKPRRGIAWVCLQERCPDAFAAFRERCRQEFDAREVPSDEVGFVDRECVLFELRATGTGDGKDERRGGGEGRKRKSEREARERSKR